MKPPRKNPFLNPGEYFDRLVDNLEPVNNHLFHTLKAIRVETGYIGRTMLVYRMLARQQPEVLDKLTILDLDIDPDSGVSFELASAASSKTVIVGNAPTRAFSHEVFLWLPLHMRIHTDVIPDDAGNVDSISLGFNVTVMTRSRRSVFENGVTHCEVGSSFADAFPQARDPF